MPADCLSIFGSRGNVNRLVLRVDERNTKNRQKYWLKYCNYWQQLHLEELLYALLT